VAHTYNPSYPEAKIRRITVWSQPGQIVHETLSSKTLNKNKAGGVAYGEGAQYHKRREESLPTVHVREHQRPFCNFSFLFKTKTRPFAFIYLFLVLEAEHKSSRRLSTHSNPKLYFQSQNFFSKNKVYSLILFAHSGFLSFPFSLFF
jgi:hypothetical protein